MEGPVLFLFDFSMFQALNKPKKKKKKERDREGSNRPSLPKINRKLRLVIPTLLCICTNMLFYLF